MDLSPIQPVDDVPTNCEFRVGDLTQNLEDYDDGSFDLIHSRYVFMDQGLSLGLLARV
jgi:hypothetical protein